MPSSPAGRSGNCGATADELDATAVSKADGPARDDALGPAVVSPLELSQGFGRGGSDEVISGEGGESRLVRRSVAWKRFQVKVLASTFALQMSLPGRGIVKSQDLSREQQRRRDVQDSIQPSVPQLPVHFRITRRTRPSPPTSYLSFGHFVRDHMSAVQTS